MEGSRNEKEDKFLTAPPSWVCVCLAGDQRVQQELVTCDFGDHLNYHYVGIVRVEVESEDDDVVGKSGP